MGLTTGMINTNATGKPLLHAVSVVLKDSKTKVYSTACILLFYTYGGHVKMYSRILYTIILST